MISAVLAGAVALIGVGPVALDLRTSSATAPQLDSLALPGMVRPGADLVVVPPPSAAAPVANSARVSPIRRHEQAIKAAPAKFDGPAPKPVAPPAALNNVNSQSAKQAGTWAVIIGVNDYPGSNNDLQSAVNDANDMVQALSAMGVPSNHMITLRDGQANDRTVMSAVDWLGAHAGPDAVAVFFYAGHVRKAGGTTEEMVLSDGSAVTDSQLARGLAKVSASRSWVAMASCFGGGFTEVLRSGRVLTGAAGANELAYENSAIDRSYMVEYMVRQAMVLDRAPETVQTAFEYAVTKFREEHPGREPVQYDDSDGRLSLRPPGVPTPERKTAEPQPPPPSGGDESEPPPAQEPPKNEPHCTTTGIVRHCQN